MLAKPSKHYIKQVLAGWIGREPGLKVLELGSGRSGVFADILRQFPDLDYTGIEPDPKSVQAARQALAGFKQARVLAGLAYPGQQADLAGRFDVVLSLSVLEHIKNLDSFLDLSTDCLRPGGRLIHLYDLGHSLYPSNFKERIQVWLSDHYSSLLPENKIAAYVDSAHVRSCLEKKGVKVEKTTYHNLRGHVQALKALPDSPAALEALEDIIQLEAELSGLIEDRRVCEKLFPAVCVWAKK